MGTPRTRSGTRTFADSVGVLQRRGNRHDVLVGVLVANRVAVDLRAVQSDGKPPARGDEHLAVVGRHPQQVVVVRTVVVDL